jgi:hypothetical protein
MKNKNPPYSCPRCNYESLRKDCIETHLYAKKKPCPSVRSNIELTDEIKQHVVKNRIYIVPEDLLAQNVKKAKNKKHTISKALRIAVWDAYFGLDKGRSKCFCCETADIIQSDFECGHVIAEALGGKTDVDNLRPICITCNRGMLTKNLYEFKKQFEKSLGTPLPEADRHQ